MLSLKKTRALLSITTVCILLVTGLLGHAEERYITDTIIVSLREGPGAQYRVIKTLKTGQSFDVLESLNGFVRVRTKDGDEGWLQDRFTDTRLPDTIAAKEAGKKTETLTPQKEPLPPSYGRSGSPQTAIDDSLSRKGYPEQSVPKESTELKKLQAELATMTKQFKQLENDSKAALETKAENDRLKAEAANLQKNISRLEQTNAALEKQQNIYWFFAGGVVFLLGWLVGRVSIRRQRHHSSLTL